MITKGNYEIWFLDYFEGRLSEIQRRILFDFLLENPDLKAEFDDFEWIELPAAKTSLPDKSKLKKSLNLPKISGLTDFEILAISQIEGSITPIQQIELDEIIKKSPEKAAQFRLLQLTKLHADTKEVYSEKQQLKRRTSLVPVFWQYAIGVAAAVSLFFFVKNIISFRNTPAIHDVYTDVSDKQTEKQLYIKTKETTRQPLIKETTASEAGAVRAAHRKPPEVTQKEKQTPNNAIVTPPFFAENKEIIATPATPAVGHVNDRAVTSPINPLPLRRPGLTTESGTLPEYLSLTIPAPRPVQTVNSSLTPKEFIIKTITKELNIAETDHPDTGDILLASIEKTGLTKTTYKSEQSHTKKILAFSIGSFRFRKVRH